MVHFNPFSSDARVYCYRETEGSPLVISPVDADVDFIETWAPRNQNEIVAAVRACGAVVFSGFNLKKEDFLRAFTNALGMPPESYKGDTPRQEEGFNIYRSTAVADGVSIPLHQEVSAGLRAAMPKYIAFFCVVPPTPGTGQTVIGSARALTEKVQEVVPDLWHSMRTTPLTYIARYLPSGTLRTRWIQRLNPSHATIERRFGTEVREVVEEKCRQEGATCRWDGNWAVVSRSGVPATIDYEGTTLFCNQVHLDVLSPQLCGGNVHYMAARALLYPTRDSLQFDVEFDTGTQISPKDASTLLTILKEHEVGRDWQAGDFMILNNVTTLHGKTPHTGEREILVAMAGSVLEL